MTKNNYTLYNSYNAEFGLGQYFANKASKDIKEVMSSGATQDVIDNVLKRSIKSSEKQMKKRAKVYGRYARKVWNTSPKLRRNVKIAGVAGAGLVGLNALTGLKTVYDIGKGIKNKIMPKKQQNAQYSLFSPYAVEFARNQQEPKEKSELQRWSGAAGKGALIGGGLGAALGGYYAFLDPRTRNTPGKAKTLLPIAGGVGGAYRGVKYGLLGYGAYRGGKALVNKIRGKRKPEANYNQLNASLANFKETQEQPKKKSLVKKGLKYAAIGGAGLVGLGAAGRYGGAALKYRLANRKYNNFMSSPRKTMSMKDMRDFGNAYETVYRGGAKGQFQRDVNRLRGRSPIVQNVRTGFVTLD